MSKRRLLALSRCTLNDPVFDTLNSASPWIGSRMSTITVAIDLISIVNNGSYGFYRSIFGLYRFVRLLESLLGSPFPTGRRTNLITSLF